MKVRELTQRWVKQEEGRAHRTREIARMLDTEMGDREISMDTLVDSAMEYYEGLPVSRVVNRLATAETIAIYDLLRGLQ